jgi:glyoxylase I family protein
MDDDTLIKALEGKLLDPVIRASREELEKLISPEFIEYGSSGLIYNYSGTISYLVANAADTFNYSFVNFKARRLSDDTILALYILEIEKNRRIAISNRSSVWRWEEGIWRVIFHQGTRVTK